MDFKEVSTVYKKKDRNGRTYYYQKIEDVTFVNKKGVFSTIWSGRCSFKDWKWHLEVYKGQRNRRIHKRLWDGKGIVSIKN